MKKLSQSRLPFISNEPLRISVNRNHAQESFHEVDIAVCDASGEVKFGMGDYERDIFPRSAMKPLQAIALLEANKRIGNFPQLSEEEIALICASHNGEQSHTNLVISLLKKFDLNMNSLICGAHWSLEQETFIEQIKTIEKPNETHNNCSGKHAGMLILAKLLRSPTEKYADIKSEVQIKILEKLQTMTGSNLLNNVVAIDGCGAPAYRAPLINWARAYALFAGGGSLPDITRESCLRIRNSIANNSYFIAGRNRACTDINRAYGGKITVKVGAEGVYSAAFHELKFGMTLKTRDGDKRGAEVALCAVLHALGYQIPKTVRPYADREIYNWSGKKVGNITLDNLNF